MIAIKHRFVALDFINQRLHHVDENHPDADWSVPSGGALQDMQLAGDGRLVISLGDGWSFRSWPTERSLPGSRRRWRVSRRCGSCPWQDDGWSQRQGGRGAVRAGRPGTTRAPPPPAGDQQPAHHPSDPAGLMAGGTQLRGGGGGWFRKHAQKFHRPRVKFAFQASRRRTATICSPAATPRRSSSCPRKERSSAASRASSPPACPATSTPASSSCPADTS